MTQTMIEHMARAMYVETYAADDLDEQRESLRQEFITLAKAALSALLEPTDAMLEAGLALMPDYEPTMDDVMRVFAAMIQAAQTEGET